MSLQRSSIRHAASLTVLLASAAAVACGPSDEPARQAAVETTAGAAPKRIFFISLDTLRADHCGFMGYARPTTPFLDSLAARGAVFTQHMSHSNNTLVSHATMLTGLVPMAHGARDRGTPEGRTPLKAGFRTLAEEFKSAGYTTASFTTHAAWLGRGFGLDQGFDEVESAWVDAPRNVEKFLDWYDAEKPERLFALLHFFDAHSDSATSSSKLPYRSREELIEEFAGPLPEGFTGCLVSRTDRCGSEYLKGLSKAEEPLPPEHLKYLIGLYDAGIRGLDDELRVLFSELERRGALQDALVVITSDHGEAFMEHEQMLHNTFHDELMHVPLIVLLPNGQQPAHSRIDAVTRGIDLAPTLLDLAGLTRIGQGSSLVAALRSESLPTRDEVFFNESVLRGSDSRSRFKIEVTPGSPSLYDLETDPLERRNLMQDADYVAANRERIDRISGRVWKLRGIHSKLNAAVPDDGAPAQLDDAQIRALEQLGY